MNLIRDEEPDYVGSSARTTSIGWTSRRCSTRISTVPLGCTVAGIRVPRSQASAFGVIDAGPTTRSRSFSRSRPSRPVCRTTRGLVRLDGELHLHNGALIDALADDAANEDSRHDMGGDIIPGFVSRGDGQVYDFTANEVPGSTERDKAYWRDVGTLDAYHESHMDLVSVDPVFNLYNMDWPIWTYPVQMPAPSSP